jgi:sulfate adenylyltransferase subunit 1
MSSLSTIAPAKVASTEPLYALKFITCGSVDDGKSTLIGRLLVDSQAVLEDHLAGVQRQGETDLALLTDGLSAEREQGITIDVAYRYFATENRKFIIGDAPGHEQYTRNMVTAASSADAALVIVDATKLDWSKSDLTLLDQTRRHSLLAKLLRVPSIVFVINKLDAVSDPTMAFNRIKGALTSFATQANISYTAIVPISALKGWNVVNAKDHWCGYTGETLISILEKLPCTPADQSGPTSVCVQWIEKQHDSNRTDKGRRVLWGRVANGHLKVGDTVKVHPSAQSAKVVEIVNAVRQANDPLLGHSGHQVGVSLERELDVSRGDWLVVSEGEQNSTLTPQRQIAATVAWMDDEPLVQGRIYWALHGHQWVKAQVSQIKHRLNILTLETEPAQQLEPNAMGQVELTFKEPLLTRSFADSRLMGAMILVDTASHKTSAAILVD